MYLIGVVSGGGVPEAQDETGNAPTGPAFPQGWISMRSGGAPPAMPPFGEPPPHVRPVPLSASEEPFKVRCFSFEPETCARSVCLCMYMSSHMYE